MTRMPALIACVLLAIANGARVCADDVDAGDGTRLKGTIPFVCTPDEKSKLAGAKPFQETLEVNNDRVKSAALSPEGFPIALSIPKTVNGIVTFSVTFKKAGDTATYFVRVKKDQTASGSFTRATDGKTLRYTIGSKANAESPSGKAKSDGSGNPALDPDVLRINGGFVRLMCAQIAIAEAHVNADREMVSKLLKDAGSDQNELRVMMLGGDLTPEKYVRGAAAALGTARARLGKLLGDDAAKVEAVYEKPYTSTYVYLNQLRAAVAELGTGEAFKPADNAVTKGLSDLAQLAQHAEQRTPAAIAKIREQTHADVLEAIGEKNQEQLETVLFGLTSYSTAVSHPATAPANAKTAKPAK